MLQAAPTEYERGGGWSMSLLFWLCLLVAGGLYGAVALSPKLLVHLTLDREFYNNQVELVRLERQVQHLERVTKAFETDPNFAAEVARIEFNASRPGNERIAVDDSLELAGSPVEADPLPMLKTLPWYAPLLERVAHERTTRRLLLAGAALLALFSFAFLHEGRAETRAEEAAPRLRVKGWLRSRYRRPEEISNRRAA